MLFYVLIMKVMLLVGWLTCSEVSQQECAGLRDEIMTFLKTDQSCEFM